MSKLLDVWSEHYAELSTLAASGPGQKEQSRLLMSPTGNMALDLYDYSEALEAKLETMERAWAIDRAMLRNYEVLAAAQQEQKE